MAKKNNGTPTQSANASASVGNGGNGGNGNNIHFSGPNPAELARDTISIIGMSLSDKIFKTTCIIVLVTMLSTLSIGAVLFSKIDRFETIFYESAAAQIKAIKTLSNETNHAVQGE